MITLDQGVQQAEALTDNLSAIAAQNQQANRNSNNEVSSAVQMTASSLSQKQAASQAQLYAATLGVQATSSSSSQANSATALTAAAAATSANQRNIRVTNARECCCEEIRITISDLAVRYNYDNFARWQEPGYITVIGRITMEQPPDWDTVVTLRITNLSAPSRTASFAAILPGGVTCKGGTCEYLDPPYTDVFETTPAYCQQIEPPAPFCENVSFLTQPLFCEVCKIEYVSAYQIVERSREFSSQYRGPGPYPYNNPIFPTVEGPDSAVENPDLLATVQICPYVGEFEFADTVNLSPTDIFDSPYYSPFSCTAYVGIKLKSLPTDGSVNVVLKQSDGITITPEDPNPDDETPAPSPYWVPGWIFQPTTNSDILNPNQSFLWSWNDSEDFTLPEPEESNPFDGANGGFAGVVQISASDYSSNNYSTRFSGDWEFDVFEKKWVIRTYDKYFRLDDSDNWQWIGPDNVDGYNWIEGQWVWSEDNERERQPSDPDPPSYAPSKSPLPAPIFLPSEQVGYQDFGALGSAGRIGPNRENFKIYAAAASGGGFSSFTLPGGPEDASQLKIVMDAFTRIPDNEENDNYFMDTSIGALAAPANMTYSLTESSATLRFDCVEGADCDTTEPYTSCSVPEQQQCSVNIWWCSESSQTFDFTVTGTAQKWPADMDVLQIRHWRSQSGGPRLLHYSASEGFLFCRYREDWPLVCESGFAGPGFFWPPILIASRCTVRDREDIRSIQPPYSSYTGGNRLSIDFSSVDGCNKRGVWFQVDFQLLGEP